MFVNRKRSVAVELPVFTSSLKKNCFIASRFLRDYLKIYGYDVYSIEIKASNGRLAIDERNELTESVYLFMNYILIDINRYELKWDGKSQKELKTVGFVKDRAMAFFADMWKDASHPLIRYLRDPEASVTLHLKPVDSDVPIPENLRNIEGIIR